VSEDKLLLFLSERVVNREARDAASRRNGASNPANAPRTVGYATVNTYVAALIDLWHQQTAMGSNHNPNPRTKALNDAIDRVRREEAGRKLREHEDRAANTILDGYDRLTFARICHTMWEKAATQPDREEIWLRTLLDHLLGHYFLARGENRRFAEFPDMQCLELDEGNSE
jgi:hypothetical protein